MLPIEYWKFLPWKPCTDENVDPLSVGVKLVKESLLVIKLCNKEENKVKIIKDYLKISSDRQKSYAYFKRGDI